ncbi:MAG: divergent polysaccharide deacetylase family protein, partial [Pseudomonadota bacterium]
FDTPGQDIALADVRLRTDRPAAISTPSMGGMDASINPQVADLGVDYDGARRSVQQTQGPSARQNAGAVSPPSGEEAIQTVRINGQAVPIGQPLSQATRAAMGAAPAATVDQPQSFEVAESRLNMAASDAAEIESAAPVKDPNAPFVRYAKAFENPEGKPTVSLIIGGLGINSRRTQTVINEMPAEVTLSFAPTAQNLQLWINRARRDGHEVLVELPMEPYEYGRSGPHPQVLQVNASLETNAARLARTLAKARGYIGVMNYQGDKFATAPAAAAPVFDVLADKGVAFIEDGALARSVFSTLAQERPMAFGAAQSWIDARPDAEEIERQLLVLEAKALEEGASLGTGMAFPMTIDMANAWISRLDEKGLVLAPASHYVKTRNASGQAERLALNTQGG